MCAIDRESLLELPADLGVAQIDLLKAEHAHLGESMLANEEMGERRVNVFVGIIAAFTAAVALTAEQPATDEAGLTIVVGVVSLVLLAFGIVTLRRLMERNLVTTEYLNGLRRVRGFFARQEPQLARVLPFVPPPAPHSRARINWWGLGRAGYLEVVAATNCVLVAVSIVAWSWPVATPRWMILVAVGGMVLTWLLQMYWTMRTYRTGTADRERRRDESLAWWAMRESQ